MHDSPSPQLEPTPEAIEQLWKDVIRVHQSTKKMLLAFEEFDGNTFLQPMKESRDALEHVIRARAAEVGVSERSNRYIHDNLSKALGHEYRALFDIADEFSITLRDRITEVATPFSVETLTAVVPDYYTQMRPRLVELEQKIATVRGGKDVTDPGADLPVVDEYLSIITQLQDYYKRLNYCVPALQEHKKKSNRAWVWKTFLPLVLGAVLGFMFALLVNWINCRSAGSGNPHAAKPAPTAGSPSK